MTKDIIQIRSPKHGVRIWNRVGEYPYVTRDGRQVLVAVWEGTCAVCRGPFQVTAPVRASSSGNFSIVRCKSCREDGK